MANKKMERGSAPLAISEIQMKTTVGYHCVPVRVAGRENMDQVLERRRDPGPLTPC